MNRDSNFTLTERLESLKAGLWAALATGSAFVVLCWINRLIPERFEAVQQLSVSVKLLGIQIAIALFSGFLFGVTYRYVIRTDQNPHLNTGAVLAFGLIRGLAAVEDQLLNSQLWVNNVIAITENLILFAVAAIALNFALQQGWIKPFSNDPCDLIADNLNPPHHESNFD